MQRPRCHLPILVTVLAVIGLTSASACTSGGETSAPRSTTTTFTLPTGPDTVAMPSITVPPGFVPADTRGARLLKVAAGPQKAPPPLEVYGGSASMQGQVNGPDGPVAGAVVRLERFVDDRTGSVSVTTGGDGRWGVRKLKGGRYRVRAWQQPSLAATAAQVVFLADDRGSAEVDIGVNKFEGRVLNAGLEFTSWSVGDQARIRALLTDTTVNADGVVVGEPVQSVSIQLESSTRDLDIGSDNPATTSGDGIATWKTTCLSEGAHQVTLRAGDTRAVVTLPPCQPKPTTAPPIAVPDFPVGRTFKVPYAGVLPAGTYATTNAGCDTTFEVYVGGAWSSDRQEINGKQIVLTSPARDFRAGGTSKPCEFQRSS